MSHCFAFFSVATLLWLVKPKPKDADAAHILCEIGIGVVLFAGLWWSILA